MSMKHFVAGCLAIAAAALGAGSAAAQDTIKIGIVAPMTGTSAAVGREISAGANLYMAQHGNMVAGKKIELIIRDDASVPDNAKRLAQEMIVNDKVSFLGACLTPSAMSMAPMATEGKVPTVVMVSGTSVVTERSPYYAARVLRSANSQASSPTGRSRTAARKPSPCCPTGRRAPRPARFSRPVSPRAAARFWKP